MATAYSSEVTVGSNIVRLKVDYSGTSATCGIQVRRNSAWTDYWADSQASITFNGTTKSTPYSYSGTIGTTFIDLCSSSGFSVSTSGGNYTWTFANPSGGVLGCSGTISIPSQSTAPTGLALSDVIRGVDGFTATVSLTSWGTGGTTAGRYKELSVCTSNSASQRKKVKVYEDTLSTAITVDNTAVEYDGSLFTINPNTVYYLTMWAKNGAEGVGNSTYTPYATLAAAPAVSLNSVTETTATIAYSTSADGGNYSKVIEYSLDGTTWVTGATVSTGSASSGTFTITGLSAGTTYNVQTRVTTTAGSTTGTTLTVTTAAPVTNAALYGSVGSQTKKVKKLYGSFNGQTKLIKKLYGSFNGVTKLVYEA